MRNNRIVAGALGAVLGLTGASQAQDAPRPFPGEAPAQAAAQPMSPNQRMANAVAGYLQASGRFKNEQIEVAYFNGVADLSGQVSHPYLRAEAIRIARSIPGVVGVRDRMLTPGMMPFAAMPMPMQTGVVPAQGLIPGPEVPSTGLPEPLSIMPVPTMPNPAMQPPPMPPYAWPTYAPYNNVSRVASPNLYPYEAFPYIGPMYPFPKVPPGWRSVSLTWQDGYWWYGRNATGHDWWRVRYR